MGFGLLDTLRGTLGDRPQVDPNLAGGLREWLEDGVSPTAAHLRDDQPLRISPRHLGAPGGAGTGHRHFPAVSPPLAVRVLVEALFRQWITVGAIGDPVVDALAALRMDGRSHHVADYVRHLPSAERLRVEDEVAGHADVLRQRWPVLPASWLPRTRERLTIPLAGGRIVLAGVADLMLGRPSSGRASVCMVGLQTGPDRASIHGTRRYLALLETLRSGAPPFRVATYHSTTGEIDTEDVLEASLVEAVRLTIGAVEQAGRAEGEEGPR